MRSKTMKDETKSKPNDKKAPLTCTGCNAVLKVVTYQMWGTKRFNAETGDYDEDDSPGNTDLEFSCPKCSEKLDAEAIIGF